MSSFFMQSYGQSERLVRGFCNKSRWGGGGRWNRRTKKPGTQHLTLVNILASVDGPAYHLLGSVFLLFLNDKPVGQPFLITQTLPVNHLGATTAALKRECKVSAHPPPQTYSRHTKTGNGKWLNWVFVVTSNGNTARKKKGRDQIFSSFIASRSSEK